MIHFCTSVSNVNKLVPTFGCFGFGIAILWFMAARRSKTVKSMTILMLSSGLFFGEGVGESGIMIGLDGEFGGVNSGEEGSWEIFIMVPRGNVQMENFFLKQLAQNWTFNFFQQIAEVLLSLSVALFLQLMSFRRYPSSEPCPKVV